MMNAAKTSGAPLDCGSETQEWSLPRLLGFRFVFVYFLVYLPPAVSWLIPGLGWLESAYNTVAYPSVTWAARHLFFWQRPITILNHGGDRTYNYFEVLVI